MESLGLALALAASLVACLVTATILASRSHDTTRVAVVVAGVLLVAACADGTLAMVRGACGAYATLGTGYLWLSGLTMIGAPPASITLAIAGGRRAGLPRPLVVALAVAVGFVVAVVVLSRNVMEGDALYGIDGGGGCVPAA